MSRPTPLGAVLFAILGSASVLVLGACGLLKEDKFIAYSVGDVGSRDIVVARSDSGDRRIVIAGPGDDFNPVWSPDHSRIAFLTNRDGNVELYTGLMGLMGGFGYGFISPALAPRRLEDQDKSWLPF